MELTIIDLVKALIEIQHKIEAANEAAMREIAALTREQREMNQQLRAFQSHLQRFVEAAVARKEAAAKAESAKTKHAKQRRS